MVVIIDNKNNPQKVSVVIPLYNKGPYIARALDSVLSQTVQDFEIIVVNDGSTDDSENIVARYNDPRIRLISQKNQGASAARNRGVDAAQAELIAFLDADDAWLPQFLETIFRLKENYPKADVYATSWYKYNSEKDIHVKKTWGIDDNWEGIIPSVFKCAAIDGVFPGCTSSTAVEKSAFMTVGRFRTDARTGEDLDMWGKLALRYAYAYSSKPLIIYYNTQNSITKKPELLLKEIYPFQKTVASYSLEWLSNSPYKDDLLLYLESLNCSVANNLILSGDRKKARACLSKIRHPNLRTKKRSLYLQTFIPLCIRPIISNVRKRLRLLQSHL